MILFVLFFCSCSGNDKPIVDGGIEYFITKDNIGLFVENRNVFNYNQLDCQIAFNEKRKMIRLQSDNQMFYVNIVMSIFPKAKDDFINVIINYKTQTEKLNTSLEMSVVKIDNQKYWLWNDNSKMGIILPRL
ncbi:MAG: hypothetical protein RR770_05605 [Bacteroidales bacterium]